MQINFMQYNMGSGSGDFWLKNGIANDVENVELEPHYQEAAKARNKGMEAIVDDVDVIFLQEVLERRAEPNKDLIAILIKKGFAIYHTDKLKSPDCLVAIKKDQFTGCENDSFYDDFSTKEFAVVKVTHKKSNVSLNLASAHIPGFAFNNANAESAAMGDDHSQSLVQHLDGTAITIVGTDMNSQKSVYEGRHSIFE